MVSLLDDNEPDTGMEMYAPLESDLDDSANSIHDQVSLMAGVRRTAQGGRRGLIIFSSVLLHVTNAPSGDQVRPLLWFKVRLNSYFVINYLRRVLCLLLNLNSL